MSSKPFVIFALKTAPVRLLSTGVPFKSSCPAVQLIVPSLFHVEPAKVFNPPLSEVTEPAAVLKVPVLEMVPPLHAKLLSMVSDEGPLIVPEVRARLSACMPDDTDIVPPLTLNNPAPLMSGVPPVLSSV